MKHTDKPLYLKIVCSVSSFVLVGACIYAFFAGINIISGAVIVIAVLSLGGPVVAGGGGIFEIIGGILEAFLQGITSVFEAIGSALSF